MSSAAGLRSTRPSGIGPFGDAEKVGNRAAMLGQIGLHQLQALGTILHADQVARLDDVAGDVQVMAVDRDVAMRDQLPGLGAAQAEAEPMHDVVQPAFEQAHQRVAGVSLAAGGTLEIAAELPLQHAVVMLHLLLLAQVKAVVGLLVAAILVHAGRRIATLDGTFRRVAPRPLQEQLQAVAPAEAANGSDGPSHDSLKLLMNERVS